MGKEIKWSERAQKERFAILEYWHKRNKSKRYSSKLSRLFDESIEYVAEMPESGSPTKYQDVRFKVTGAYLLYYSIQPSFIEVITIWDSRRNPKKLKL